MRKAANVWPTTRAQKSPPIDLGHPHATGHEAHPAYRAPFVVVGEVRRYNRPWHQSAAGHFRPRRVDAANAAYLSFVEVPTHTGIFDRSRMSDHMR